MRVVVRGPAQYNGPQSYLWGTILVPRVFAINWLVVVGRVGDVSWVCTAT